MLSEHRLQIYLPERDYRQLKARAKKEGRSIANMVREGVAMYLARTPGQALEEGYRRLEKLSGAFRDDGAGAAEKHDEFLGSEGRW
jgi:hypothetical protein